MRVRVSRELVDSMGGMDFGVRKIRGRKKRLKTPEWMRDKKQIVVFLQRLFPLSNEKIELNTWSLSSKDKRHRARIARQRKQAARWATVITRYFVCAETSTSIEFELRHGDRCKCVTRTIQRIRLASANGPSNTGRRQDGKPRTGRPKGRPRKLFAAPIPSTAG
jgi:hypothetical protein